MIKRLLTYVCWIGLALLTQAQEVTFESVLTSPSWKGARAAGDTKVKLSLQRSIRIWNDIHIHEPVELNPDTVYELTYYIKGKDVAAGKGEGAWVIIRQLGGGKKCVRSTTQPHNRPETGTFDWRKGTYRLNTAEWGTKLSIALWIVGKGTVWLDEMRFREIPKVPPQASFRCPLSGDITEAVMIPRGIRGFFDPGQKVFMDILIEKKPSIKQLEYEVRVKDESGKPVFSLPRRKFSPSFTIPGQPCGYYVVEADFYADGRKAYTAQSAFAVNRKFDKRDPFFQIGFGFMPFMKEGFKRIGVGAISLKLGHWENLAKTSDLLLRECWFAKTLDEGGFVFRACFNSSHVQKRYRSKEDIAAGYPVLNDKLVERAREYVTLAVKTANGRVRDWTIQQETPSSAVHKDTLIGTWSESMANLVVMTRIVSRIVRKNVPGARIFCGGNNVQKYFKDIERITLSDLVDEFDHYIIDAYTGNWDMTAGKVAPPEYELMSMYREASALSESLGKGKLIGNEEAGYCINYGAPFDRGLAIEQARLTSRMIILSKAGPVSHFEVHSPVSWLNNPQKDSDPRMNTVWKPILFGSRFHCIPLPGGAMYATAAAQLSFASSPRLFSSGDFYSCIFTKPDGSTLLVLWNISENVPVTLDLKADAICVNMYGRESSLKAGKQTLTVGPAPLYLTLKYRPEKIFAEVQSSLRRMVPEVRCAGYYTSQDEAALFFRNVMDHPVKGSLKMSGVDPREIVLPPGNITSLKVKTRTGKGVFVSASTGRAYAVALPAGNFHAVSRLGSKPVFDGSGAWFKNLSAGELRYPDHIRPFSALQQELCYFKCAMNPNGHSVSAKYWTGYDSDHFYLAAEVDDPVHQQRYSGKNIWKDDSLQLAFANGESIPAELLTQQEKSALEMVSFGVALTSGGTELVDFAKKDGGKLSWPVKVTRKNNRTLYEVAIPFMALGGRPKQFGFIIFDNNYKDKAKSPYWLQFCEGIAGERDPGKLKTILYK